MVPKIFSGSANRPLAEKVCQLLEVKLSPLEIHVFPDGEKRVRVVDRVLDQQCVVIQSTSIPAADNYMELFFIIDALKRSGAKSVTAVIPYLGYQRQDHIFKDGEAVSLDVVVKALEAAGATKIITFDLHTIKIPELFNIPVTHLSALPLFASKIDKAGAVLISPDMGGIRRIKIISELLGNMPYATVAKDRDLDSGEVAATKIEGEVSKIAIIVDDMISSGKTITMGAKLLKENGAEEVIAMATHAVFSEGAAKVLQDSVISKVIVTDSIEIAEDKKFEKLEIVSIAGEIAKEIKA